MKKIIFGIFAHPDDEAFGPSGTLLLETRSGTELHLVSLTAGENGTNPDEHQDLGTVRLKEWRTAGKLMGATSMHHLGYIDGELNNQAFLKIVGQLEELVRPYVQNGVEIEFMTTDLNGVTGHIDHIVAARAACFVFYKLKQAGLPMTRIRLACMPYSHFPQADINFVFMEPGRRDNEISETIDARSVIDEVYAVIRAHHTQRGDGDMHIASRGEDVAVNHFIVLT